MLNKDKRLKKVIKTRAVIICLLSACMLTIILLIFSYSENLTSNKTTKENQNNSITHEKQEIEKLFGLSEQVMRDYNTYITNHNPDFIIKREAFTEILPSLSKQYHFANMEANVSSITEMSEAPFKLKTGKMLQSKIKVNFSALTDNSIYNFIYDLQHKLPGIMVVSELKLSKTKDVSNDTIKQSLTPHTITPFVVGEISLLWVGIEKDKKNEQDTIRNNKK